MNLIDKASHLDGDLLCVGPDTDPFSLVYQEAERIREGYVAMEQQSTFAIFES